MERTLRTGFFRVGEHWAFVVWPASLRGHSCFSFVLPSSSSLFLSLSLLHLGFVSPRLWQSFILYHKLCFVSTHAHTSKHLPPSPILFMDHCARTNWHMYIHKELFFSPSPFVCVCVCVCVCYKEAGRFLLQGWPVQEVLVPFSLSLSLALAVWRLEVCSCKAGHLSPTKKIETQKICHKYFFFFCQQRSDPSSAFPHAQSFPRLVSFFSLSYFYYFFFFVRRLTLSEPGSAVTDSRCVFHR